MRVSIIGAGDIKFHYNELLEMSDNELSIHLEKIAFVLKETDSIPVALPDRGIPFELTKKFKEIGGEKAIGVAPLSDNSFGITHMNEFIESNVGGKKVFDEVIDTDNWYKQDMTHCLFGETILVLGITTGSLGELAYGYYLYNLMQGHKPGVKTKSNMIHEKIVAGSKIPLNTIVYMPFVKGKLPFELEKYIEKFGGKVFYVKNSSELKDVIIKLKK
jgi:hypothetical protein